MSHYFEHLKFYNNPVRLSKDYRNDPMAFLQDFFCDYHLVDLRCFQDEILKACMTTDNPPFDRPDKRANTIFLHKNIELLFEAAFLILKKHKAEEARRKRKGATSEPDSV